MKKTLKIVGISLVVLIGLLVAAAIALSVMFDPNQYKPEIIKLVKDKTGRDLKIDKKIGWSFFPRLGIETGGVELSNAPGFGKDPFARIDAAGVHVAFLPLLSGRIEVSDVYLRDVAISLAKDAAGRTNWDDLSKPGTEPAAKPEPAAKGAGKLPIENLAINHFEIRRANLNWHDIQSGSRFAVHNLDLTTGRFVANQPMDLKLSAELAKDQAAPIKLALQSRLIASADALKLGPVDLKVDDSRLTGSIEVRNFANPALRFDLALDQIDLDRYLGGGSAAAPAAKTGDKKAATEKPAEVPLSTLRGLDINGKFSIGSLKAFNLHSSDARIQVNAKNGLITLGPNSAKLYQGGYRGQTEIDARGKTLQFRINENLEKVQLGPLLKDMKLFDHYSGAGNVAVKVTAQGFDAAAIKRSLNGNAAVSIKDGQIDGVDLGKFAKILSDILAKKDGALDKATRLVPERGDHTVFGQMNGTFQIANGVARNSDLVVRAVDFSATGKGSADLVNEKMDYRLELATTGNEGKKCKTLPLRIDGPFSKLSYLPDMQEILKCQAQKQVEKQLQKGLEKGLENLFQPKKKK